MTIDIDKLMNSFRDYDVSMELKKINEDARVKAFNKKKKWLVDALDQHISYIGNDKHKIKIDGDAVSVKQEKSIKEFSEVKELVIDGNKKRCLVVTLKFKGSPSFLTIKNQKSACLPLPDNLETGKERGVVKKIMELIRDDIAAGKYDEQIEKFGSKKKPDEVVEPDIDDVDGE
jgi:hypothetical protein